jgi:cathepsin B
MRFIVAVLALAAAVMAMPDPDNAPLLNQHMIDAINADGEWEASLNSKFADWKVRDAKRILGTKLDGKFHNVHVVDAVAQAIPAAFDARTQWPNGQIHPIRNQEQCGSCWAFGATESFSDRQAIASNNSINVVMSPQDLVSCDNADGNQGCDGGYPIKAWQYMVATGVPSDDCYPYTSGGGVTGNCKLKAGASSCTATGGTGPATIYKAATAYAIAANNVAAMQTEIMTYGPIEVAFSVYQDFFSYTSGVYVHKTGALDGGHAVKIIGWGTLNNVAYWTVANSWGTTWGMDGFFLIKRGVNECGIEAQPVAGHANA